MTTPPPAGKNRSNLRRVRQILNPAWLAGAISIGFHGVLFAAGPSFPDLGFERLTEAEEEIERRNVPLVELSAAEQARLPDFSGSFYNFEAFGDLEPLAPLFGDSNNASGSSDGSINSKPLLSPGRSSLPPSASRLPFGITSLEPGSRSPFSLGVPPPPLISSSEAPEAASTPSDESETSTTPGAEALQSESGDSDETDQTIAANSNPTDTLTLAERLEAYTFDGANIEPEEINVRFDEWLVGGEALATELEIADPDAIIAVFEQATAAGIPSLEPDAEATEDAEAPTTGIVQPPIELSIDYEGGICLTTEPQTGLIGAWVSAEGSLASEPMIIRSTGYPGLNEQAIRYVETLDFSAVEAFTGYQFEVVVNHDPENCVSIEPAAPPTADGESSENGDAPENVDGAENLDNPESSSKAPAKGRSTTGEETSESTLSAPTTDRPGSPTPAAAPEDR
ncbi:MAG: hypothetical protein ACFB0E_01455 [Leptolyngbyaceae cyanobacterium]